MKIFGATYTITKVGTSKATVEYKAAVNKKATSITVPATVKIKGVSSKATIKKW